MSTAAIADYLLASRELLSFRGRVAIVSGAAAGIGQATAVGLAARGAAVMLADIDGEGLQHTAREIEAAGGRVAIVTGDVTEEEVAAEIAERTRATFGAPDILVNNVGGAIAGHTWEFSLEDWNKVLRRNLQSCFLCSRAVIPHMLARGYGRIVCVSSGASQGTPWTAYYKGAAAYAASKSGVEGFVRHLALELAQSGITVNAVAPGPIETERLKGTFAKMADLEYGPVRMTPLRRLGRPWEVAATILFASSEEAGYITGQTISVAGGR
ncbi:SDR family NAD(P)-dependent oxidoreductase [Devosia sp.]|uniref:SDR family NAD(P)-dependent oxidoreductase n=1 Tax=Devosia sp. TaxID=1871048 RepID=UPI002EF411EF